MKIFTQLKCVLALVCGLLVSVSLYAQERSVSGTVTDGEDGSTIPGVNVLVKGTSTGTITDINGEYNVTVTGEDATLVFSSVGFMTQEIPVGSQASIDLAMQPDVQALEEIVVTGVLFRRAARCERRGFYRRR